MLSQIGLPTLTVPTVIGFVGNGVRRLVERALDAADGSTDPAEVDRALRLFLDRYGAHLLDATVPYDGIPETLARLKAVGCVLSVATNKPAGFATTILQGLGLASSFASVLGGDSLPVRKPDPSIVHELARRAGVALDATLMVGDSTVDVATARAAGVAVCAVTWGLTPADRLRAAAPDYVIAGPAELLALVS